VCLACRLAFLAPTVVDAILHRQIKAGIDGRALLRTDAMARHRDEQDRAMVANRA
jgi:hypothetical protein